MSRPKNSSQSAILRYKAIALIIALALSVIAAQAWITSAPTYITSSLGSTSTATNTPIASPSAPVTQTPTNTATATPEYPPCGFQVGLVAESFDGVTSPTLPVGWTATNVVDPDGVFWQTSNSGMPAPPAYSVPNAAWINDPPVVSDKYLDLFPFTPFEVSWVQLRFQHNFSLQKGFDGGVLEVSANNGPFRDIITAGGSFVAGGYSSTISTATGSPIAGRQAWSGNSGGFTPTIVNVPWGFPTKLRWRMASDNSGSSDGWRVDQVSVMACHIFGTSTPTPTATLTPTFTPTNTSTNTPTPTRTQTPFPELDLTISQTAPAVSFSLAQVAYTLTVTNSPAALGGGTCPTVRFGYPTGGLPFTFASAGGTNGYVGTPDAGGVTFTGGCVSSSGGVPMSATLTVVISIGPTAGGTLTSLGSNVVVDPENAVPENNENNNTAQTVQTQIFFKTQTPTPTFTPTPSGSPISVSLPNLMAVQQVTVPMSVGDLTGRGVTTYQFHISYNAQSVWCGGFNTAGTLSSGMTITATYPTDPFHAGHLIVTATGTNPLSGSGTLINLLFGSWDNQQPRSSSLVFQDYTDPDNVFHSGFRFNDGDPPVVTTNGSIVLDGQRTPTATATATPSNATVQFSSAAYITNEGQLAAITITRTGDLSGTNSVFFSTTGGTATGGPFCTAGGGTDYITVSQQAVIFGPGDAMATANVETCADTATKGGETVNLGLSSSNITLGTPSVAVLTINGTTPTSTATFTPMTSRTPTFTPTATFTATATSTCTPLAFTNPDVIPINDGGMRSSVIPVSNFLGTVTKVTVDLNGVNHSYPDDIDIMLVGPGGQNTLLMSDAGGDTDINGSSFTFDDAVPLALPDDSQLSSGTFGPTNYDTTTDVFPASAPAPGGPVAMGVFIGTNPNGVWTLYVRDDTNLDTGIISGGWTLHITTTGGSMCATATATATATSFQPTPMVAFSSSTYSEDESQVAAITIRKVIGVEPEYVTFSTFNGTATGGTSCTEGVDYINVSQQLFLPRFETEKTVYVTTCGDSLREPDETINLRLSNPILGTLGSQSAVLTLKDAASAYRNTENISITARGASLPCPSSITVSGAPNNIGSMRVTLYDLSVLQPDNLDVLLVGPNGTRYILLAGAGGLGQSGPVTLNFSDSAGAVVPDLGALTNGTFEPTSWVTVGDLPPPAPPGPYNLPGSAVGGTGTQTLAGNFGGTDANGMWSLYLRDRSSNSGRVGNLAGGWGLEFLGPTATNTPTFTPTSTATSTPTFVPTQAPAIDLSISQSDSPDPMYTDQDLTYTLIALNIPQNFGGGEACPIVRFVYPSGVPFVFVSATGTNGYHGANDASGVTFTGGCISSAGGTPRSATLKVIIRPISPGTLTSTGTNVVIDPNNNIPETYENNNSAQTITTTVIARSRPDFDGDGKSDISVFRPSSGAWYLQQSQAGFYGAHFGFGTDKIVPADYDGDGKTDIAAYRPSDGVWYVLRSTDGNVSYYRFGLAEDLPTPADYDGDGKADISVFRPSSGTWYRQNSSNGSFFAVQFGVSEDKPTVEDFDGDGKADIAVFRPSNGTWYRLNSSDNSFYAEQFGISSDLLTPGDYDGDGKADLAVFRPSTAIWYLKYSSNSYYDYGAFGLPGDVPAHSDFDGDGRVDICVFRPSDGTWYWQNSSSGALNAFQFGTNGDMPTQTAFRY